MMLPGMLALIDDGGYGLYAGCDLHWPRRPGLTVGEVVLVIQRTSRGLYASVLVLLGDGRVGWLNERCLRSIKA